MTFYLQIIHFIALEPTVKKILGVKIPIFYTSVLKLLQQKYKLPKDAVCKTVFSFSTPLLVLEKIFKGNAFLARFGPVCT
jgi:hypothetical protein